MKIKKGDTVVIIAGKDRGKTGTVLQAYPKKEEILVEGVHVVKKHQRSSRRGQVGQIVERPMPIHVSNAALTDKKENKPVRVGYSYEGEDTSKKKIRVARPSGEKI